jgi:tetratricopeptide (TPR) repeat protein
MQINRAYWIMLLLLSSASGIAESDKTTESKTVIGPRNPDLTNGARALLAGDIEEGVRLTEAGLKVAHGRRERQAGLENLCAGYVMLENYDAALEHCNNAVAENDQSWRAYNNRALLFVKTRRFPEAEADLEKGQELAPHSSKLKEVRGILLDETHPVRPRIVIDDRRAGDQASPANGDDDGDM